ncbi:hypothetical protein L1987_43664 [Smallanthus sonchifolius]|uniref:Uncharacterized protein n=1 Tax=Smallanthus sonchifolius TaxID=185202 RepID=A0ACB9GNB9_9ASTR|nr:hypothetical protein L1987_43664 [Smallanthus sonchifolius]
MKKSSFWRTKPEHGPPRSQTMSTQVNQQLKDEHGEQTEGCMAVHPFARSYKARLASPDSGTLSFVHYLIPEVFARPCNPMHDRALLILRPINRWLEFFIEVSLTHPKNTPEKAYFVVRV